MGITLASLKHLKGDELPRNRHKQTYGLDLNEIFYLQH